MPYAVGTVPLYRGEPIDEPVELTSGVFFGPIEPWILDSDLVEDLARNERQEFLSDTGWALSWDGPPDVLGSEPDMMFALANLAIWLVKPSSFCVRIVATFEEQGNPESNRQVSRAEPLYTNPQYHDERLARSDLELAGFILPRVRSLATETGALASAFWALWRALREPDFVVRYSLCWIAIEALFGPEDGREITYRLSQRCALFLGSTSEERRNLFKKIKSAYSWRSKVVHGMKLQKLAPEKSEELMLDAEMTVRSALNKILSDSDLIVAFDGRGREALLDDLVF